MMVLPSDSVGLVDTWAAPPQTIRYVAWIEKADQQSAAGSSLYLDFYRRRWRMNWRNVAAGAGGYGTVNGLGTDDAAVEELIIAMNILWALHSRPCCQLKNYEVTQAFNTRQLAGKRDYTGVEKLAWIGNQAASCHVFPRSAG